MESALEDFASEEGLRDEAEIIEALRACRDDDESGKNEWKKLDKMIDTMTKKEEFFVMMMKKAERTHAKQTGNVIAHYSNAAPGGKTSDSAGSKSSKK
jgi:hypothetical protein